MKIIYRLSDGSHKKNKLPFADKFYCLDNFIEHFPSLSIYMFADNCKPETLNRLKNYSFGGFFETNEGSSGQSFRMVAQFVINNFNKEEIIYFVEDDYLHKQNSYNLIVEGIEIGDYVTLYDHPDKYINKEDGGNPLISNGGENTKVFCTNSCHWKQTNSTTMTFACKLKTLIEDWEIWEKNTRGKLPHDDLIFYELQSLKKMKFKFFGKKRKLISCIPGHSTHVETKWLSPITNWNL